MDTAWTELFVERLARKPGNILIDRPYFAQILSDTPIDSAARNWFSQIPGNQQLSEESERYHFLSLDRVIYNRTVAPFNGFIDNFAARARKERDELGIAVRSDEKLVGCLRDLPAIPGFSLLGTLTTYEYDNPDERLYVITRPVLVTPRDDPTGKIADWERENTTYERESGIMFLRTLKRISRDEYLYPKGMRPKDYCDKCAT